MTCGRCCWFDCYRPFRERLRRTRTVHEMNDVFQEWCQSRGLRSCDSVLDALLLEFESEPATDHELLRWHTWHAQATVGSMADFTTTTLLLACTF